MARKKNVVEETGQMDPVAFIKAVKGIVAYLGKIVGEFNLFKARAAVKHFSRDVIIGFNMLEAFKACAVFKCAFTNNCCASSINCNCLSPFCIIECFFANCNNCCAGLCNLISYRAYLRNL